MKSSDALIWIYMKPDREILAPNRFEGCTPVTTSPMLWR